MSSLAVEVSPLEDLDLDLVPPCQLRMGVRAKECGAPSVCLMKVHCEAHGNLLNWLCGPCRDIIVTVGGFCVSCWIETRKWNLVRRDGFL